ncbi:GIN domain-containing protein [Parasphingorhabdus sp.]|uniref:GIN domain-containing protein n=1 Tax=Parasphingorhabdus sp. TaxID=2709688 RepID=UPI003BB07C5D
MKNLFVMLLLSLAAIAAPAQAAERKYSISSFEDVRIIGNINVFITTDRGVSASAEAADRETLDRVELNKSGKQLIVSVKPKASQDGRFSEDEPVAVRLSSYVIKSITHSGSGTVSLDKLGGRDPKARINGFGVLTINAVDGDTLDLVMNGGGQMVIAGRATKGQITMLGSSILDGSQLTLETLDLTQRGPASSHVLVEKEVTISNSGTGRIQIDGRPNCSVKSGGSAQIICDPKS